MVSEIRSSTFWLPNHADTSVARSVACCDAGASLGDGVGWRRGRRSPRPGAAVPVVPGPRARVAPRQVRPEAHVAREAMPTVRRAEARQPAWAGAEMGVGARRVAGHRSDRAAPEYPAAACATRNPEEALGVAAVSSAPIRWVTGPPASIAVGWEQAVEAKPDGHRAREPNQAARPAVVRQRAAVRSPLRVRRAERDSGRGRRRDGLRATGRTWWHRATRLRRVPLVARRRPLGLCRQLVLGRRSVGRGSRLRPLVLAGRGRWRRRRMAIGRGTPSRGRDGWRRGRGWRWWRDELPDRQPVPVARARVAKPCATPAVPDLEFGAAFHSASGGAGGASGSTAGAGPGGTGGGAHSWR